MTIATDRPTPTTTTATTTTRRPTEAPGRRQRFDWLEEPRRRRGGLLGIELAVRSRWLEGPGFAPVRAALIDALGELAASVELPPRELFRIGWIFVAMDESNLRLPVGRPGKVKAGGIGV